MDPRKRHEGIVFVFRRRLPVESSSQGAVWQRKFGAQTLPKVAQRWIILAALASWASRVRRHGKCRQGVAKHQRLNG